MRTHIAAGAAHTVGAPHGDELGTGGGGSATIELPVQSWLGVQASAGGIVLSKGDTPADANLASRSTAAAFTGTAGVRVHPLAGSMVAGPWIDVNGGFAQTGGLVRPVVDTHVGWDFRVSKESRWDVGPFLGYTQIIQPNSALRPDDGRIVWAGIAVSLGARSVSPSSPAPVEPTPPPVAPEPVALRDADGGLEASSVCPEGTLLDADGCITPLAIVDDRIVLGDVIHFQFDSPKIRVESYPLVRRIATFIVEHPEINAVHIEGHADAVGTDEYNQRLSIARASSTRDLLVASGADGSRLAVVGHGKSQLKFVTPYADPRNRRVEFIIERRQSTSMNGRVRGGRS